MRTIFFEFNNLFFCRSVNFNFVFDFIRNKLFTEKLDAQIVGHDDTSVFLRVDYDQKWQKVRYYDNSIFQISGSGIKVVAPILNKHQTGRSDVSFFNTNWKVTNDFLYDEEKDCKTISHYKMKVFYEKKLIDTLYHTSYLDYRSFYCNGDTLILNNYPKETTFFNGKLTDTLNYFDYLKQLPLFGKQDGYERFERLGNYLLFRLELVQYEEIATVLKDDKLYTLNGMPWRDGNDAYQIVAIFDFKTKKFLGYPQLEYVSH